MLQAIKNAIKTGIQYLKATGLWQHVENWWNGQGNANSQTDDEK